MRNDKLSHEERDVVLNNESLHRYLVSLEKGRPETPRSWLYEKDATPEVTLDHWMKILKSLENGTDFEKEVFQFDTSQLEKWGPQGHVLPISKLMDVVEEGFKLGSSPKPKIFDSKDWKMAKSLLSRDLARRTGGALRPAPYSRVLDDMRARDTLESNSGWPLFARRNLPEVVSASVADAESGQWKTYPAIALFRNYNNKTRLVWMFPMSANLVEGSYFQPLQSSLINYDLRYPAIEQNGNSELAPWHGFEWCRRSISSVYNMPKEHLQPTLAASDFSSTDAHFTVHQTMEVFDVIKHCFQKRYWHGLEESLLHMQSIPLVVGEDSKITGLHGVSSGSNWTNFIETIFDMLLGEYVSITMKPSFANSPQYLSHERVWHAECRYAIGDDMLWYCHWFDEGFAAQLEDVGKAVGQVIKKEKTTNDPGKVKTLQRLFQRGYNRPDGYTRGVYSTIRALKSSVYPERFHKPKLWSSDMFCARQYMILENCVDHPLFEQFVKFVVHGQRDLIPFAKKSTHELDDILRKTKLLPGFNPTYNQERRDTSLGSFESIKIASKL
jgi:hypothetical protein